MTSVSFRVGAPLAIPMSYNDAIFVNTTAGTGGENVAIGVSWADKSYPGPGLGSQAINMLGANTMRRCRFGAPGTPVREGIRIAGTGPFMFDQCYIEVDGLGGSGDHADGMQTFSPTDIGTVDISNSFFRAYRNGDGPGGEGSIGVFLADNWTSLFKCRNVIFQSGGYGCRAFPDARGDIHIDFDSVYFVAPFAADKFDIGRTISGHITVIDRWTNVYDATIVGGVLVPGTAIPSPI